MVEKAPIVKEYKRAGTFLGARGTRVLRLVTTFLTLGILVYSKWTTGAGFYCLMYVPFDESHGENVFSPVSLVYYRYNKIRRWYFAKRNEFFGVAPSERSETDSKKFEE